MDTRKEQLQKIIVKDLKSLAKSLKIKNNSRLNKDKLINTIIDFEIKPYKDRCKPYVCKGNFFISSNNFITCSECFSFSTYNKYGC